MDIVYGNLLGMIDIHGRILENKSIPFGQENNGSFVDLHLFRYKGQICGIRIGSAVFSDPI